MILIAIGADPAADVLHHVLERQTPFTVGRQAFMTPGGVDGGFGPVFNGVSCASCHDTPIVGGMSQKIVRRVGYRDADGTFRLDTAGAMLGQESIGDHRCQPRMPEGANVVEKRLSPPLFGAGLIDAIADAQIVALEDPEDRDGDGIRGRAARVIDVTTGQERVGRFGWKAQQATLLGFAADAYANEMGVTNRFFPREAPLGVTAALLEECDAIADPEDHVNEFGHEGIDSFVAFMSELEPLARGFEDNVAARGRDVFMRIGCVACHVPELRTAPNAPAGRANRKVEAFSDFLLHDVGTGPGLPQAAATALEYRTAPLWGIASRTLFLHDGRAGTLGGAIDQHAGEAATARRRFVDLPQSAREALIAFLMTL